MADQIKDIGERLKLLREAKGMTQAAFSRTLKIDQQQWNNYERGFRRISIDQATKVCIITGATLDWIYRGVTSALPLELALQIQARAAGETEPPARWSR